MYYQEFLTCVTNYLEEHLSLEESFQIQSIPRNNGTTLDAVIIHNKDLHIAPTIYLMPYYHRLLEGVSLDEICEMIWASYQEYKPEKDIDVSFFTDYSQLKEHIIYKLVNYEKNRELLKKIPHFRYLDFAIIFCSLLSTDYDQYGTILIHNEHIKLWGVTQDELFLAAQKNTPTLLPYSLESMADVIQKVFPKSPEELDFEGSAFPPMYILSNQMRMHGACCILYDGLLEQLATEFGKDLILLPSSIHEFLIVPVDSLEEIDAFHQMVKEVNETQVSDEEILANHAYYYSIQNNQLTYPNQFIFETNS